MDNDAQNHNDTVLVPEVHALMPTNIMLKSIPDHIYQALKRSAESNHRSINGEVIACLSKALMLSGGVTPERLEEARRIREQLSPARFSSRSIRAAIKRGRP
jgi:hypothetical protein